MIISKLQCTNPLNSNTSVVPRPPPFLPSVCTHNDTHGSEKQGRPRSIHHMSGREVDVGGGGGLIFKYVRTKLKSMFLINQDE